MGEGCAIGIVGRGGDLGVGGIHLEGVEGEDVEDRGSRGSAVGEAEEEPELEGGLALEFQLQAQLSLSLKLERWDVVGVVDARSMGTAGLRREENSMSSTGYRDLRLLDGSWTSWERGGEERREARRDEAMGSALYWDREKRDVRRGGG
jgi:hypothetical protein